MPEWSASCRSSREAEARPMSGTSARKAAMAMTVAMAAALMVVPVANAATYDLVIDELTVEHSGTPKSAIAYNGQTPGPTLRFKEGEEVTTAVTNQLDEATSIHWHGDRKSTRLNSSH